MWNYFYAKNPPLLSEGREAKNIQKQQNQLYKDRIN